jgi:hypothetical protein
VYFNASVKKRKPQEGGFCHVFCHPDPGRDVFLFPASPAQCIIREEKPALRR